MLITHLSMEQGGRNSINICSGQNTRYGGADFWLLILDDSLNTYFINARSDLPETIKLVQKEISLKVKSVRLDKSGQK
jgi:hypothetical protein